jgi:hypothetical protein
MEWGLSMALDTGIYNALMRPPKSALDYQQEYAQNDLSREQAAQARQMNALSLQQHQMTLAEAQRAQGEQATVRNALASSGATDMQGRIKAAEGTGTLSGIKQADDWRKAQAEQDQKAADARSKNATAGKSEYDLQRTRLEHGITSLTASPTPAHARQAIMAGVQDGTLDAAKAQQALSEIPDDPAAYQQWRQSKLIGVMSAKDALDAQAPKLQEIRQGDRTALVDVKPTSLTYGKEQYSAPINASPDALVLAGTQRGGQIITDTRERDLNAVKASADKPLTEGQSKALLFGTRMQEAHKSLDALEKKGVLEPSAMRRYAGDGILGDIANARQSPAEQQVEQAQRDFLNAVLRKESGAAIGKEEFTNARKQYFPQVGDSQEVRAQKARNRDLAINGMLAEVPDQKRSSITPGGQRQAMESSPRATGSPVLTHTKAEYDALPRGTAYIGTDGKARMKP